MIWRMTAASAASFLALASFAFAQTDEAQRIKDLERQVEELRVQLQDMMQQRPQASTSTADLDRAVADLAARLEKQGSPKGGANVVAPKVKSVKIGFEDRVRAEVYRNRTFGARKGVLNPVFSPTTVYSNISPSNPSGSFELDSFVGSLEGGFNGGGGGKGNQGTGDGTPGPSSGSDSRRILDDANRILNRLRLNVDVDVSDRLSASFQLQQSRLWGTNVGESAGGSLLPNAPMTSVVAPAPPFPGDGGGVDPDQSIAGGNGVAFRQAYIVAKNVFDSGVDVTLGRMALNLGDGRLLSSAEWDNVGRAFDGLKLSYASGNDIKLTAIATKVVQGGLDFQHQDTNLVGAWLELSPADNVKLTPYTLWLDNNTTGPTSMIGKPWTIGSLVDVNVEAFHAGGEIAIQQDHDRPNTPISGARDINFKEAIAYSVFGEFAIPVDDYKPTIGVEFSEASKYFNDLYGSRHGIYGMADIVTTWNNLSYWKLYANTAVVEDVTLNAAFYILRLNQDPAPSSTRESRRLGEELDLSLTARCSDNITTTIGWSHFFNGWAMQDGGFAPGAAYASEIGHNLNTNEDADFFFVSLNVSF